MPHPTPSPRRTTVHRHLGVVPHLGLVTDRRAAFGEHTDGQQGPQRAPAPVAVPLTGGGSESLLLVCDPCQLADGPYADHGQAAQLAGVHDLLHHHGHRTAQVIDSPLIADLLAGGRAAPLPASTTPEDTSPATPATTRRVHEGASSRAEAQCGCCRPDCVTCDPVCTDAGLCPCPDGLDRLAAAITAAHLPTSLPPRPGRPGSQVVDSSVNDVAGQALAALTDPDTARLEAAARGYEGWLGLCAPAPWDQQSEFARDQVRAAAGELAAALTAAGRRPGAVTDTELIAALRAVADGLRRPAPLPELLVGHADHVERLGGTATAADGVGA